MKKIIFSFLCLLAITAFTTPARAHCGACGVGGDEEIVEACKPECTKAEGDHGDCPESCTKEHESAPDAKQGAGHDAKGPQNH